QPGLRQRPLRPGGRDSGAHVRHGAALRPSRRRSLCRAVRAERDRPGGRSDAHSGAIDLDLVHDEQIFGKDKLTNAWLDSKLKTISTARNWNTVLKLCELMRG